ncbi:MAG: hypothetical protein LBC59_07180 [Chitinispirillales bacterium]|jgi:hypothetical protein|nr:hypothetical protein [Chitinispirillales bacterium]
MGIRKLSVFAVALSAFAISGVVFAQEPIEAEEVEEEVVEEEVPPPAPIVAPVEMAAPAPEVAAQAQAVAPAVKPETKVDLYGAVQYRFRDRLHSISDTAGKSGSTNDYQNLLSWRAGLKAKVNDQLSLQIQIGNDWGAGEGVNWANNNSTKGRLLNFSGVSVNKVDRPSGDTVSVNEYSFSGFQNLYVHIASFKWNPGYMFVEGGVISLPSYGTLDLLERSINLGKYDEAAFQGWSTELNATMIGIKLGVPILKDDFKLGVELFQTVIDERTQSLAVPKEGENVKANPSSPMFVITLPIETGALKVTPEITAVLNRNYNRTTEKGDDEILYGLAGSYAVNKGVSVSVLGGYGSVSNENSGVGKYGDPKKSDGVAQDKIDTAQIYSSEGMIVGVGANIKAGPGAIQFDFKYNSAVDAHSDATEDKTKYDYMYTDIRYAYKANDKFTITPRYRNYYRTFPPKNANKSRMENRLELILEGSF